ncbi:HNH endonuclease [Cupriavidus taiwanensis]|uniref:HNH endonuclease n=1 Tax=Cupriavidus taiwanensis TaxID=164546 RepID=UPI0027962FB7|nr:HNH endonuclease [Cupriavidus taiwanensis]
MDFTSGRGTVLAVPLLGCGRIPRRAGLGDAGTAGRVKLEIQCSAVNQRNPKIGFLAEFGLSRKQALQLQWTAEHLHARVDDGRDSSRNIVAACHYCNALRHRRKPARDPINHKEHVQRLMRRRRWHAVWVFDNAKLVALIKCKPGK